MSGQASNRYSYDNTFEVDETDKDDGIAKADYSEGREGDTRDDTYSSEEFDDLDVRTEDSDNLGTDNSSSRRQDYSHFNDSTQEKSKDDANENATEKKAPEEIAPDMTDVSQDETELVTSEEAEELSDPSLPPYQEKLKSKVTMSAKLCLDQCELAGKRVLVRVDYDVPLKDGVVVNNQRIKATLPTIKYARKKGARCVILMSHLGQPEGRVLPEFSLRPVAYELQKLLKKPVTFLNDCVGPEVEAACSEPRQGTIILLENLRFHKEEEGHGLDEGGQLVTAESEEVDKFRHALSSLGDVFVNDDFGSAHLAHSSVVGCTLHQRALGFLMKQEVESFSKVLENPKRPLLAILGGAKLSEKCPLIENLLDLVDEIIITGKMALTFQKALNAMSIGDSLYDGQGAGMVPEIVEKANSKNVRIHLPIDFIVGNEVSEEIYYSETCTVQEGVPEGMMALDVGTKSNALFTEVILRAKTLVWNGSPSLLEVDTFATGTKSLMDAMVKVTRKGAFTILVGEDAARCARKLNKEHLLSHVSIGGRASLELLEGNSLPGMDSLSNAPRKRDFDRLRLGQCSLAGQRVMVRTDLDVRADDTEEEKNSKLSLALPTIQYVLDQSPRCVILLSHMGHPGGRRNPRYSLRHLAEDLQSLLGRSVLFLPDCVGQDVEEQCSGAAPGVVILLENVRFHPEEEGLGRKDGQWVQSTPEEIQEFRSSLSRLCDVYINDVFRSLDSDYSSIVGVDAPQKALGLSCCEEVNALGNFALNDKRPYLAIIGGREKAEKLSMLEDLLEKVDEILIAGGLAHYFLKATKGLDIKSHLFDDFGEGPAFHLLGMAAQNGVQIHLPVDFVVGDKMSEGANVEMMDITENIPSDWQILDIGEVTYSTFKGIILRAKKIVWYGSPGVWELDIFSTGTKALVASLSEAVKSDAAVMILGDSTTRCWLTLNEEGVECHVTKNGRAALAFLAGSDLPGITVLDENPDHKIFANQKGKKKKRSKKKRRRKRPVEEEIEYMDAPPLEPPPPAAAAAPVETITYKYVPPYNKKLPPLQTFQKPKPRLKYTGAPPPGQNKPYTSPLFRRRPWLPPMPAPTLPKKPPVPRLSGMKEPHPTVRRRQSLKLSGLPYSQKYKVGESGVPGFGFVLHPIKPLPPITETRSDTTRACSVPVQLPTVAKVDSRGNLTVSIDGDSRKIPPGVTIQVTLVSGYTPMNNNTRKPPFAAKPKAGVQFGSKLVPLPPEYADFDPGRPDDLPGRGRFPRLNTTMTLENYVRYRRIFH